jgi:hypothetical protein
LVKATGWPRLALSETSSITADVVSLSRLKNSELFLHTFWRDFDVFILGLSTDKVTKFTKRIVAVRGRFEIEKSGGFQFKACVGLDCSVFECRQSVS